MKAVTISLAIAAAAITWAGAKAKTKPCVSVTYYYMDMAHNAKTVFDFKVSYRQVEENKTRKQCLAYRNQIHRGPPKVRNNRTLLDAICAPCGHAGADEAARRHANLQYWDATLNAMFARQWEQVNTKRAERWQLQRN